MALAEKIDQLEIALDLRRKVVGVTFLYDESAYERDPVPPVKNLFSFCMMVKVASSGAAIKAREENFKCPGARRAFGMMKVDDHYSSGGRYFSFGLYQSLDIARKTAGAMALLPRPVIGVTVQPLKDCVREPDVAIIIADAYNVMRVVQGYTYHFGPAKQIQSCGNQGVCCELTAQPFRTKDINVSLLCSGTRFSCRWEDGELGVGMPFSMLPQVIDGVLKTADPTEPDRRKRSIMRRAANRGSAFRVTPGENYYRSDPGTGKLKPRAGE